MPPTGQFEPKPHPKHPLQPRAGVRFASAGTFGLSSSASTLARYTADGASIARATRSTCESAMPLLAEAIVAVARASPQSASSRRTMTFFIASFSWECPWFRTPANVDEIWSGVPADERLAMRGFAAIDARSLSVLRVGLATFVLSELVDRWGILAAFYSDEGILPTNQLDPLTRVLSVHAWSGSALAVRALALAHGLAAALMLIGWRTRAATFATWYLYVSMTMRNCGVAYIADRYAHFFLLLAAFVPCAGAWSVDAWRQTASRDGAHALSASGSVCSAATMLLRVQIVWIYLDAGWGKAADAEGAWLLSASVPALETMLLHTPVGRGLRALLQPVDGVRNLTASVVWAECALPPLALLCAGVGLPRLQVACAALMVSMHAGIGLCMNNALLLSFVAAVAWAAFIPAEVWDSFGAGGKVAKAAPQPYGKPQPHAQQRLEPQPQPQEAAQQARRRAAPAALAPSSLLLALACVVLAFNARQSECDMRDPASAGAGSARVASALLHNRWNVFTSGEDHVRAPRAPSSRARRARAYRHTPSLGGAGLTRRPLRLLLLPTRAVRSADHLVHCARALGRRQRGRSVGVGRAALVGSARRRTACRPVEVVRCRGLRRAERRRARSSWRAACVASER